MPQHWKNALLGGAAGCFLTVLILWPTLISLTQAWRSNQAYQYAWLVVPVIVYLLGWFQRPVTLSVYPKPDLSGVGVAVLAALCWIAADLMNIDVGRQFALVLAIQGVCMAALGWRCYWQLSPILWLMFLMVPSGDLLQPVLRQFTVKVIEFVAIALHLPHQVNGFQIVIGDGDYIVLNECAGLPYFLLATFLGYVFGLMLYRSIYKILALALFGALIGLISNALRVTGIVLIDWVQGSQMPLTAHQNVQWVALIICLAGLFYVLGKLDEEKFADGLNVNQPISRQSARLWTPVLAGLAVMIVSGGGSWAIKSGTAAPGEVASLLVPKAVAGWQLATPGAAWVVSAEEPTRSLSLAYRRDGKTLRVRLVEAISAEAKLLDSDVAPGKTGLWHENRVERLAACVDSVCMNLLHTIWENGKTEALQHVYSTYALGDLYTTSKLKLRAAHGWARLTGSKDRPRLIGLGFEAAMPRDVVDGFAEMVRSFQPTLATGR